MITHKRIRRRGPPGTLRTSALTGDRVFACRSVQLCATLVASERSRKFVSRFESNEKRPPPAIFTPTPRPPPLFMLGCELLQKGSQINSSFMVYPCLPLSFSVPLPL